MRDRWPSSASRPRASMSSSVRAACHASAQRCTADCAAADDTPPPQAVHRQVDAAAVLAVALQAGARLRHDDGSSFTQAGRGRTRRPAGEGDEGADSTEAAGGTTRPSRQSGHHKEPR